jgi:hypothetical protein
MMRFLALVAVLMSCVVVAGPGAQASQRLTGSTVCRRVPTSLGTGPDGNVWYTVTPPGFSYGRPDYAVSIYRMTRQGKVTAFPIPLDPRLPVTVDHITSGPGGNLWFTATTDSFNSP